jgi:hypothetical protein
MVLLSIVIVTFNAAELLCQCLTSIFDTAISTPFEVIVVDNHSSDQTIDHLQHRFPGVRLVTNSTNRGFAAANNQGLQDSTGKYILLLNPDTIVLPGTPDKMVKFLEEHPRVGLLNCQLLNPDMSIQLSCGNSFPSLSRLLLRAAIKLSGFDRLAARYFSDREYPGQLLLPASEHRKTRAVGQVTGACMMVRKDVILEAGMLDEDFFMFLEETDWCFRIRRAGWLIYYTPEAQIIHMGSAIVKRDREQYFDLTIYHNERGKLLFVRKHACRLSFVTYKLIVACMMGGGWAWTSIQVAIQKDNQEVSLKRKAYGRTLRMLNKV